MVWCGSTEVYREPAAVHATVAAFEKGLRESDPDIAPSQIYAYAALKCGVPFANGAPNLTVDTPALLELARENERADRRQGLQDRPDLMKTILAPGLKARMLGIEGWYSTNILGNRDGEVLDDPESFKTKEVSKLGVLDHILQPDLYPDLYGNIYHMVRINYYPPARRQQGGLGQHRHLRVARLPDADQGQLPVPRLDPGRAARARPGAVPRPRPARRHERHPGVAELLLEEPA